MRKAKGFTLIDALVIAGVLAILPGMIWPSLSKARESARRAACLSNLKQIILGIKVYTPDYDEYYPTSAKRGKDINVATHYRDMGILYPTYVMSLDVFTCPSSGDKMPKRDDDKYDNKPFRDEEAKQVSYAYGYNGSGWKEQVAWFGDRGPGKNGPWTEAAPSETRVLADRHASKPLQPDSNHKLDGRNVAYADGHVRWVSGKSKLLTNPDHLDPKIRTQCWWSERGAGK